MYVPHKVHINMRHTKRNGYASCWTQGKILSYSQKSIQYSGSLREGLFPLLYYFSLQMINHLVNSGGYDMEWLNSIIECCIDKINGTPVERAISEEVAIMKAEVKLAELSAEIQKESAKITDADVKESYTSAVDRIRAKQQ